jgi:hypothetical protein
LNFPLEYAYCVADKVNGADAICLSIVVGDCSIFCGVIPT